MAKNSSQSPNERTKQIRCQKISIEILPDDVLLEIFDSCVNQGQNSKEETNSWQLLIHVCRRWRIIVFGSPRRLNLRLFCTPNTPVGDTLGIWPAFPFLIQGSIFSRPDAVNTNTMLNYSDRIRLIDFKVLGSQLNYISAAMEKPFPELTHLLLDASYRHSDVTEPVLTDLFLGGSAPRLQVLSLSNVTFLGLPRLLLSATHLVSLYLNLNILPRYEASPEAISSALPALTRLEMLKIEFAPYGAFSDADGRRPPPFTHTVLPALTRFTFRGSAEYFETLVAQLDAPLLNRLSVAFYYSVHNHIHTSQLAQFIDRVPRFRANDDANIVLFSRAVTVKLASRAIGHEGPVVSIQAMESVSTLTNIFTSSFPSLSTLERLYVYEIGHVHVERQQVIRNPQWLEILRPFTAVKDLYISQLLAPSIMSSLQDPEVLPILQNIFIEGFRLSRLVRELFADARQLSGRRINISDWNRLKDVEQDNFQGVDDFE